MAKWIRSRIMIALLIGTAVLPGCGQAIVGFEVVPESASREQVKRLIAEHAYSKADAVLAKLLQVAPGDRELLILQALNSFHERDYTRSRRIVNDVVKRQDATAEVRVLSGLLYVVANNLGAAKQEELRGATPLEWLRLDLASMLLTYQRSMDAAVYLADAQRISPGNPQVYSELGQMYFQEHRYGQALIAYGQVLELDPFEATAHYFRGRAYHFLGQDELSRAEFILFARLNRQHSMVGATSSGARSDTPGGGLR